jgi:hypothetical protein
MQQEHKDEQPESKLPVLVLARPETAAVLRISVRKLDYLIERGELRPLRIGGRVLVAWSELCRFVAERQAAAIGCTGRHQKSVVG